MAPADKKNKLVRYGVLLLKLLISATLFYFLISKVGGKTIIRQIRLLNPLFFMAAIGLYLLNVFFSTLRWQLLLPRHIGTRRLFGMYLIGSFFNLYMPGGVGGDAVKAYYLSREMKGLDQLAGAPGTQSTDHNIVAIASVFMDRYFGLSALLTVSIAAFPFGFPYLKAASGHLPFMWVIPSVAAGYLLLSIAVFKFKIGERLHFMGRAYRYLHLYIAKRNNMARALLYSLIIQILVVISIYILSKGLLLNVSFLPLLIFVPIIILVSMIPVSISGIGLREGAFVFLLQAVGVPPELSMSLSIVWYLSVFSASLLGLFEYLRFKAVFGGKKE